MLFFIFVRKLSSLYFFSMPPKPKTKIKSAPSPKAAGKGKVKPKRRAKQKVVPNKYSKVKSSIPKSKTGSSAFPLEGGPTPSQMKATDITRLYKLPNDRFETEGDVIAHNGYMLEEKVTNQIDCTLLSIQLTSRKSEKVVALIKAITTAAEECFYLFPSYGKLTLFSY